MEHCYACGFRKKEDSNWYCIPCEDLYREVNTPIETARVINRLRRRAIEEMHEAEDEYERYNKTHG